MHFSRLSIVLSTHPAQFNAVALKGDIEANLARIASWGYDGVELAIRDPDLVDVGQLEIALANYGLKVPAIGTGQAWGEEGLSFTSPDLSTRRAAIERIKRHLALAKHFNAIIIIGLIRGLTPPGQSRDQTVHYLIEALHECVEIASRDNVFIALEPLNRYETDLINIASDGLEVIRQIGSPHLGLLLDTFHMNIEEGDIHESILQAGKHIIHFHVADSNRCYPGAGHLNFKTIFDALWSTGFQGWISGEFLPNPDADTAAQRSIAYLSKLLV